MASEYPPGDEIGGDAMAVLEVWDSRGHQPVTLDGDRVTIGSSADNDLTIGDDPTVSRLHAKLERIGDRWGLNDLGSTNGTRINGRPLFGEHVLHDGDEMQLGRTRLVFRDRAARREPSTNRVTDPPKLTPREREVLVKLCRPLLSEGAFTPPASVAEIAAAMFVTEAAVKQHLSRLFDKFGIEEGKTSRRVRLANEAVETGAVQLADLRPSKE